VPHGLACAALLAPVIGANVRALRAGPARHPALDRYARAAWLLTGDPVAQIEDGLAWIRQTLALLAVPGLGEFGVRLRDASEIAARALVSSSMQGNPVALSRADLEAVLRQAL
jgi:alcohol dehydrogenase class IV